MPALKYWDPTLGWVTLIGGNAPPAFKPVGRYASDNYGTDVVVNATSYGASTGPSLTNVPVATFSIVVVWFYAKVTLGANGATTSDLYATIAATGANTRGPFDSDGLYIPPQPAGSPGPGHIAGVMGVTTNTAGNTTFTMNYRVTGGATTLSNRRLAVVATLLVPGP
jgi:hypothetical protein